MKVNSSNSKLVQPPISQTGSAIQPDRKNLSGTAAEKSKVQGADARVSLSSQAREIAQAKEIAQMGLESVDEAKVARLQSLIDSGEYKVDADALAERMMNEHLMMRE